MRLTILFICLCSFVAQAQEFPNDWLGSYKGKMIVANPGLKTDTIDVDFEMKTLEVDSVWSYNMIFYSNHYGTIKKDYKIVAKSKANKRNYLLDENNGIVMELTLMDGTFYGMYNVMEMMFISTMRYTDEGNIYYDLFAAPMADPTVTRTTGEESIEATSYGPSLHQTALFIPQE